MADIVSADIRPLAEDFVKEVNLDLNDIKQSFFRIGFRLSEANSNGYYRDFGFENISDCAEALFGFKKTTTYDLMQIYWRFHNRAAPLFIDKPYVKYSQSQLVALCSVGIAFDTFFSYVSPDDTVGTIKKAAKLWNGLYNGKISRKGNVRYSTLHEFIEIYSPKEPIALPASTVEYVVEVPGTDSVYTEKVIDDSVQTENDSGYPENENIDLCSVDSHEAIEDLADNDIKLYDFIYKVFEKFITNMGYKVSFIDSKGMPLRVLPDHFAMSLTTCLFREINNNPTELKHWIKNISCDKISSYNYEIMLCNRKQGISSFCGTLGNIICDGIIDEYLKKFPDNKKKKRR
jgi:hypothetical protein